MNVKLRQNLKLLTRTEELTTKGKAHAKTQLVSKSMVFVDQAAEVQVSPSTITVAY